LKDYIETQASCMGRIHSTFYGASPLALYGGRVHSNLYGGQVERCCLSSRRWDLWPLDWCCVLDWG